MTPEEIEKELDKLRQVMIHGSTYKESYALALVEMFKQGKTVAQFCAAHDIGRDTFNKWTKKHKLFAVAYTKAQEYARDYYDAMRERYLQNEVILEEGLSAEGEPIQIPRRLEWNAFNKMYSCRFNIADKRAVQVKGLSKAKDEREMLKCLNVAIEEQELTPDEAQKLASLIDVSLKIKQTQEFEERLSVLEADSVVKS